MKFKQISVSTAVGGAGGEVCLVWYLPPPFCFSAHSWALQLGAEAKLRPECCMQELFLCTQPSGLKSDMISQLML